MHRSLVVVGVVILFSSVQSAADHTVFYKLCWHLAAQMGVAKSDFEQIRFD